MNINEAVKDALEKKGFIRRHDYFCREELIKPTNQNECCIFIFKEKYRQQSRLWHPTADDLMADDWEVVTDLRNEL